jgi:hypothetical protein
MKYLTVLAASVIGVSAAAAQSPPPQKEPSYPIERPTSGWPASTGSDTLEQAKFDSAGEAKLRVLKEVKFDADKVQWAAARGTATIEGQAFLKTRGGDVKLGAGNWVYLIPECDEISRWFATLAPRQQISLTTMNPGLALLSHMSKADADGRFKFVDLPAGNYFVLSRVDWEAPGYYGMTQQGGFVMSNAATESGKTVSVLLTQ